MLSIHCHKFDLPGSSRQNILQVVKNVISKHTQGDTRSEVIPNWEIYRLYRFQCSKILVNLSESKEYIHTLYKLCSVKLRVCSKVEVMCLDFLSICIDMVCV